MAAKTTTNLSPAALQDAAAKHKALLARYKSEPQVERSLSPLYEPYLGKVIQISINGITIAFPVDGISRKIPESFADELDSRRLAVDASIKKSKRMSDVGSNSEKYAGEIRMF